MKPIITSLLDTDLYKFTMQQVVLHHFPQANVEYRFKCRTPNAQLGRLADQVSEQVQALGELRLQPEESAYLNSLRFIKPSYTAYLENLRLNPALVHVQKDAAGDLDIHIKGPWFHTILFEVPLLSIINELHFRSKAKGPEEAVGQKRLQEKIALLRSQPGLKFSDFGTRRRFSKAWQEQVVSQLAQSMPTQFTGTSNVALAMKNGVLPIGTMAHEYLQACQALGPNLRDFQKFAFQTWAEEYRGDLGIALSDVVGMKAFLRDFDMYFCKLFDGARHDSGDPIEWGEQLISHYQRNRVDPKTKTMVFSDGLTAPKAIELYKRFHERSNPVFGIGTNLTNDLGFDPLNIVIKMTRCNDHPVAKLSDSPGKTMCEDQVFLDELRRYSQVEPAPASVSIPKNGMR